MAAADDRYVSVSAAARDLAPLLGRQSWRGLRTQISNETFKHIGALTFREVRRAGGGSRKEVLASSLTTLLQLLAAQVADGASSSSNDAETRGATDDRTMPEVRQALAQLEHQVELLTNQYESERVQRLATQRLVRGLLESLAGEEDQPA